MQRKDVTDDMTTRVIESPYPWFGGKSKIMRDVWRRFGQVRNFVDPFFGSAASILCRPQPFDGTETINDLNAWLTNFWRAIAADPDGVAAAADWPVSELDLHARGDAIFYRDDWYVARGYESVDAWIEWIRSDPAHYDSLIAGWWVWGQCAWIGDNWGRVADNSRKNEAGEAVGVVLALPHLSAGQGVNRQRPHLGDAGRGVNRKRPHLGNAGRGVNRQLPHLGNAGQGVNRKADIPRGEMIRLYMQQLSARFRNVRICCGDWSRVCGPTPTVDLGLTAVFLDPPYGVEDRDSVYGEEESRTVATDVRAWCLERGDDPRIRICLCGYDGEHNELEAHGWQVWVWKAHGGYASQSCRGNNNRHRERCWFSPHCLNERTLFV